MQKLQNDGFDYNYFPSNTAKAEGLAIILHGHASSPDRWVERCEQLQMTMPNMAVIALQGQLPAKNKENPEQKVYGWLDLTSPIRTAKTWLSHIFGGLEIARRVNKFAQARLQEHGLSEDKMVLIGSSAGGIVAMQAAFSSAKPYGAVLGLATSVLPFSKIKTNPEVFMCIGDKDEIFNKPKDKGPLSLSFNASVKRLKKSHIASFNCVTYKDTKHEVTDPMWYDALDFAQRRLKITLPPVVKAAVRKPATHKPAAHKNIGSNDGK